MLCLSATILSFTTMVSLPPPPSPQPFLGDKYDLATVNIKNKQIIMPWELNILWKLCCEIKLNLISEFLFKIVFILLFIIGMYVYNFL
jgi:hypothetical protein